MTAPVVPLLQDVQTVQFVGHPVYERAQAQKYLEIPVAPEPQGC
jgi:hypothetical protein